MVAATTAATTHQSAGRIVLLLVALGCFMLLGILHVAMSRETTALSQPTDSELRHKPPHLMFKETQQQDEHDEQKPVTRYSTAGKEEEKSRSRTPATIAPYKAWKTARELRIEPEETKRRNEAQVDEDDEDDSATQDPQPQKPPLTVKRSHFIYRKGTWDGAPIVVPELKLLFFTTPKVGCTVFKQLFRRIAGYKDWRKSQLGNGIPHAPDQNGLNYLYHYSEDDATEMLTSPEWTRAMFVREPKDRILSAYLDKGRKNRAIYVEKHCCPKRRACVAESSFAAFLQIIHHCRDPHWVPQSRRMERQYWPYLTFVGHIENARDDTERMLQSLSASAWETYGASGWGEAGTEPIFTSTGTVRHSTGASDKLREYYTDETEGMVEDLSREDFENPLFGFELTTIVGER